MKNTKWIFLLLAMQGLLTTSCPSQNKVKMAEKISHQQNREPVVSGSFYPSGPGELRSDLKSYFAKTPVVEKNGKVLAVICPHAGYVFSGQVAAAGYKQLDPETKYKHIFLIGSSHYVGFTGASIYNLGNYETPLGEVKVDIQLTNKLIRENDCFVFDARAHAREHSLEVQLPFLQYRLKQHFLLVPIVLGSQDPAMSKKIADALKPYFNEENLFVISTDLSHYPTYEHAVKADQRTLEAVLSQSPAKFLKTLEENARLNYPNLLTSMCGWPSTLTLLDITKGKKNIHYQKILYKNSGDTPYGEKDRVVGYGSIMVTDESTTPRQEFLSKQDKVMLLSIARGAIRQKIVKKKFIDIDTKGFSPVLLKPTGAFVTLTTPSGELRGCIGRFQPKQPLYLVVRDMAVAAALHDYRFKPVKASEIDNLYIEISVLTPLKQIHSIDEFQLGKQGIYMVKDGRSGTFLPQVALDTGWDKETFLGHCAQDKAGIGWDGWKEADLFTYEAIIFSEKEMGLK